MARFIIKNLFHKTIEIRDASKSMLKHFQDHGIDWMFACGGKGRCTTCRFIVVEGESNFESLTPPEERYMSLGALKPGERLACQVRVRRGFVDQESHVQKGADDDERAGHGNAFTPSVTVIVPRETQLPHMQYSED